VQRQAGTALKIRNYITTGEVKIVDKLRRVHISNNGIEIRVKKIVSMMCTKRNSPRNDSEVDVQ